MDQAYALRGAALAPTEVQLLFPLREGIRKTGARAVACSRHSLGRINLPRQTKTEIDWDCFPPCVTLRCRDAWVSAYATVCGPEDIVNGLIDDVVHCVGIGLAAAGLSAIFAGPQAALPAFEVAFKTCLYDKVKDRVNEISLSLSTEEETADWGAC